MAVETNSKSPSKAVRSALRRHFRLGDALRLADPRSKGLYVIDEYLAASVLFDSFDDERAFKDRYCVRPVSRCVKQKELRSIVSAENDKEIAVENYLTPGRPSKHQISKVYALFKKEAHSELISIATVSRSISFSFDDAQDEGDEWPPSVHYFCTGQVVFTRPKYRGRRLGVLLCGALGEIFGYEYTELVRSYRGRTPIRCVLWNSSEVYTPGGLKCAYARGAELQAQWETMSPTFPKTVTAEFEDDVGT